MAGGLESENDEAGPRGPLARVCDLAYLLNSGVTADFPQRERNLTVPRHGDRHRTPVPGLVLVLQKCLLVGVIEPHCQLSFWVFLVCEVAVWSLHAGGGGEPRGERVCESGSLAAAQSVRSAVSAVSGRTVHIKVS